MMDYFCQRNTQISTESTYLVSDSFFSLRVASLCEISSRRNMFRVFSFGTLSRFTHRPVLLLYSHVHS